VNVTRVVLVSIGMLIAGCAQPAMKFLTPPEPPVVWPAPPDAPRVRYVGQLTGSEDIGAAKSFGEAWDELLYGPKPPSRLVSPHGVAVHAGGNKVAVADANAKCAHVFDLAARKYTAMARVGGQAMESPAGVCWVKDALWVTDARLHAIAVFDPRQQPRWIGKDKLLRPSGMAYCPVNQLCYVCDTGAHGVRAFDAKGTLVLEFGSHGAGPGQFNYPLHIACGPGESLVVSDALNFRVQRLKLDGTPLGEFGKKGDAAGNLALPKGIAVDGCGTVWVVDANFENVQAFTAEGQLLMAFGQEGHGPGEFWLPTGMCVDAQKRMWVADNRRVQVFALLQ
jgi:DNA-binding beta-propeller fold protein YncE